MGTQENTEKVLRQLYLLLAQGEPYEKDPNRVIVDKKQAERLLNDLNRCVYEMMEYCEVTTLSRDRAERIATRHGEKIVQEAQEKAEDVYAASIIYSEEALNKISAIMRETSQNVEKLYDLMEERLKQEERALKKNQTELRSQLHVMKDTDKYFTMMKEWREEERLAESKASGIPEKQGKTYANRQKPVKVNKELLEQMKLKPVAEVEADDFVEEQEKSLKKEMSGEGEEVKDEGKKDEQAEMEKKSETPANESADTSEDSQDTPKDTPAEETKSPQNEQPQEENTSSDNNEKHHTEAPEGLEKQKKEDDKKPETRSSEVPINGAEKAKEKPGKRMGHRKNGAKKHPEKKKIASDRKES